MAENLTTLAILIEVVDRGSEELEKFERNLKKSGDSFSAFAKGFAQVGVGMGVAVGTALAAVTQHALEAADEMGKAAQKAGLTVESMSALAYAGKLSDVSLESLTGGMKKLSNAMLEAQDKNSEMANAFKALGVSTTDVNGKLKSADTVFAEMAKRFKDAPDGITKTAVATQIFGKAGADLIPLLNSGADGLAEMKKEAEDLGLIYDEKTTKAAEEFNDTMTKLGTATDAMGLSLAKDLVPTLQVLANKFMDARKHGGDFQQFLQGISQVFNTVVKMAAGAVNAFDIVGKAFGALAAEVAFAAQGDFDKAAQVMAMFHNDVVGAVTSTQEFAAEIDKAAESANNVADATEGDTKATESNTEGKKTNIEYRKLSANAANKETNEYNRAVEALLKEAESYKQLTSLEQIRIQITTGAYQKFSADQKQHLLDLAAEVDATRLSNLALKEGIADRQAYADVVTSSSTSLQEATERLKNLQTHNTAFADSMSAVTAALRPFREEIVKLKADYEAAMAGGETKLAGEIAVKLQEKQKALAELSASTSKSVADNADGLRKVNEETSNWNSLIQDTRDETTKLVDEERQVKEWWDAGKISVEEFNRAMQNIDTKKIELAKSQMSDFDKKVTEVAKSFQDQLTSTFYDAMQGQFDNTFKGFKQLMDRMVAEALSRQLMTALFGDFNKTGQVSSSSMGSGFLTGLTKMFGFRANGGDVQAGSPYIVGEKQAEVFIPNVSGTILPSVDSALKGMSSNNISLSITAMDSQDVLRAMDKIKRPLAEMMSGTNRTYNLGGR